MARTLADLRSLSILVDEEKAGRHGIRVAKGNQEPLTHLVLLVASHAKAVMVDSLRPCSSMPCQALVQRIRSQAAKVERSTTKVLQS